MWKSAIQWKSRRLGALHEFSWNTGVSRLAFVVLSCFLVSFTSLDRMNTPEWAAPQAAPVPLISEVAVEKTNPVKSESWGYFYPAWKRSSLWAALQISQSNQELFEQRDPIYESFSDLEALLDDPSNKIEPEFKVPDSLRGRVHFWLQVFGRFSSRIKIVHDRYHPEVIYGYIDMRPLFRATSSLATAAHRSGNIEKRVLKELRARLLEAGNLSNTRLLDSEEKAELQNLLVKLGGLNETAVKKAIRNLRTQTGQSDMFLAGVHRAKSLLPEIEKIFQEKGLPTGLARIPFVESSFNPKAYSRIGAIGLWQFVRETARHMIHEDSEDRWRDPLAQSKAAARLLKLYRNVLPDWGIAITAYNSGVGRMRRLTQKYGIESVETFGQIPAKEDFGFAGRNFYAEFLAVNILEHYKETIFDDLHPITGFSLVFRDQLSKDRFHIKF
ncbi:MAG: hypothetical protein EBQ85_07680 [Proteobacteria bacterium]|nr:hypothetical protein [Pseudomonadota bacterium]